MTCHHLLGASGVVIGHVCRAEGETRPHPNQRRKRFWCFRCRKRSLHTRMVFYPALGSYYGPHGWWECPSCHEEHVLFPGHEWVEVDA